MGTTVAAVLVNDSKAIVANVGDSRAYLYRAGGLRQLTVDDTWVESMAAQGLIDSSEVRNHPMRNMLMQAAGAKERLDVHVLEHDMEAGDVLLLSSDGLHGVIGDDRIRSILGAIPGEDLALRDAAERLVAAAKEKGAPDNVSVVLLSYNQKE